MGGFRDMLARLEEQGELVRCDRRIDLRYVPAVLHQADKAVLFERVHGYDMPVVGGLYWTRRRLAGCLGWPEREFGTRYLAGTQRTIEPVTVTAAPCQEVVLTGDDVDLSRLPVPTMHERDGGPYIASGVVVSSDPDHGPNAGVYRLMLRGRDVTGIDLVTASDMRTFYERRLAHREPLPVAVAIGVHAFELIAAGSQAPVGTNEFAIAGGLHDAPVELVQCRTVDLRVPAHAEIVLEGYLEPIGWTKDEGPFGEFAGMQGDLKWNPVFRVTAATHRRDAIFHTLQMPWENDWLSGPVTEAHAWRILREAGLRPVAVRATEGGCCFWNVVAAIDKRTGEGKNALLALLALPFVKTAIVVDPDIDIYDPVGLEWAITFRCQPDLDVLIVSGAKAKHVDPSVRPWELKPGTLPLTSKMGVDATLPEGAAPVRFERLKHVFLNDARAEDYLGTAGPEPRIRPAADVDEVATQIEGLLRERPCYFHELLAILQVDYRSFMRAWFEVRARHELARDALGHYSLA